MLINIHEFVSFDNDKWLMYQVPDINFHTDTKTTNSAYCYAEHGRLNIFISSDWLHKPNDFKIELIKHELAHGMFGHIGFMKGKTVAQRKLFNIVADCSIHVNTANPQILEEHAGKPCTYESCNLRVLPPEFLYHKLWEAAQEKMDKFNKWVEENLNDSFWKIKPNKDADLDSQIIKDSISSNIRKAQAEGVHIPGNTLQSAGTNSGVTDVDYDYLFKKPIAKPKWLQKFLQVIHNYNNSERVSSYRREPHNPIHPSIIQKGRAYSNSKSRFLFAIDCSGSMDRKEIDIIVRVISQHLTKGRHKVLLFDTEISTIFDVNQTKEIEEAIRRFYGGTTIKPVFDYASPEDHVVVYTDGGLYDIKSSLEMTKKFHNKPVFLLTTDWNKRIIEKHAHVITIY